MAAYKKVIIVISFALMFGGRLLPSIMGLSQDGMLALGIFAGTLLLMLFVDTSWPLAATTTACVAGGLLSLNDALSNSIGHRITVYLIFATMLAYSLRQSGFLDRVAHWVVTRPLGQKHPWAYMTLLLGAPLVMGFVTDLMANLIVFYSVFAKVMEIAGYKKGDKMPKLFFMCLILVDGMACGATPISHAGTVFGMGLYEQSTGQSINFASYCLWGILFSFLFLAILIVLLRFVFRMDVSGLANVDVTKIEKAEHISGPLSTREKWNLLIFGACVAMWIIPGLLQFAMPDVYAFWNKMGTVTPAMIGCVLLAVITVDGKPLMDFREGFVKGTAWGAVLLTGTVMLLVKLLGVEELGITPAIAGAIEPVTHNMSGMVFVFFGVFLVVMISNFCSNTVSNTLIYTLTVPLVLAGTVTGVHAIALTCVVTYGCELAIATPAGSAYAGMMNGFGWFDSPYQLRTGLALCAVSSVIIAFLGYPLGAMLLH